MQASLVVATGVKAAHEIRHVLCLVRSLREHHPDADDVPVVVWDLMTPSGYLDPHDHDRYQRGHLRGGGTPGRGAHHKRPAPSPVGTVSHLQFVRDRLRARVAQLPGVEYRRFPFERLPPHFTTDGSSGGFHAWQPLVLMEHLLEGRAHGTNRAPVLWYAGVAVLWPRHTMPRRCADLDVVPPSRPPCQGRPVHARASLPDGGRRLAA